jgi:hypothetical protein
VGLWMLFAFPAIETPFAQNSGRADHPGPNPRVAGSDLGSRPLALREVV